MALPRRMTHNARPWRLSLPETRAAPTAAAAVLLCGAAAVILASGWRAPLPLLLPLPIPLSPHSAWGTPRAGPALPSLPGASSRRAQCYGGGDGAGAPPAAGAKGRGSACFLCCGHRGARRQAPENTLSSFLRAFELGANCVEMDVHRTRDGRLAVAHGRTVAHNLTLRSNTWPTKSPPGLVETLISADEGPQGPEGPEGAQAPLPRLVEDMTWRQVRSLDAGAWRGAPWAGECVPELPGLLRALWARHVTLVVELKIAEEKATPRVMAGVSCASPGVPGGGAPTSSLAETAAHGDDDENSDPALAGTSGSMSPGSVTWEGLVAESVLDLLFSAPNHDAEGTQRLASFSLMFSSFNHRLIDLIAAGIQRKLREQTPAVGARPWLLVDALAGLAYIYGPNTTVCAEHLEERADAREGAGPGAPSAPLWVALHDSLLPGVMHRPGKAQGLRALTWVTDGLEAMAGLAGMGAAGVTTNRPELCKPLCGRWQEPP